MQIAERYFDDNGKLIIQQTHDPRPVLDSIRALRDAPATPTSDSRHIGRIPGYLLTEWLREAGVAWHDQDGVQKVIKRKMLSGEFAHLRVWNGSY